VNDKILLGKGVLEGHAQDFIDAANKYHINEIYLISHALLESDKGTSPLATGDDGLKYFNKKVYNLYGIHAFDSCPDQCGGSMPTTSNGLRFGTA
jgi:mannosyl-glycoprotein endo-beta-N-acetylglucosaminidase